MFRFTLTYSGADTEVEEPRGWSDFKSEIKRDFKSHGVIFRYTSGLLKLGFADGRDILENAFQNEGFDAVVTLTVDKRQTATDPWVTVFTGNAVMENRELEELYFNVDFETSTFQQKVINRLDTKVKLDATEDLDGNTLSGAISSETDGWSDIRLINKYEADFREGGVATDSTTYSRTHITTNGTSVYSYFLVNYEGELVNTFKHVQTIAESDATGQLGNNSGKQNFVVSSNDAGDITINGTFKYRFHGTLTTNAAGPVTVYLRLFLRHENGNGIKQSEEECFVKAISNGGVSPFNYDSGVITATITETTITGIDEGDRIFLYAETEADVNEGGSVTTTNEANIDWYHNSTALYSLKKEADTNNVKHFLIHDVVERILYIITGENGRLNSGFLGITELGYAADGCGGLNTITNGFQLRGINNFPEISLKEVLDSLHAIYGIGYSFENVYGVYKMRVELMEYFYGDGEILDLGNPIIKQGGSYKETTFNDLSFNSVEIGFSKFTSDENYAGDIDDFLTRAEYNLPLTTVKGKYTQISPMIASGRVIQAGYETKDDTTKSWKHDEDNFIVAVLRSGNDWLPELDENFETLGGFSNSASDTAYNLRFAPVYMFLNHALIVNSCLMGKALDTAIKNTSFEINKSFSALFNSDESCLLGDSQRLTRTSVGDIDIGNNYEGNRLFDPIQHELTVAMTSDQLDTIIDAMENNASDSSVNYGYLTYRDNEGNVQTGYPLTIKWNPNKEIAEITTLEKADNYGV